MELVADVCAIRELMYDKLKLCTQQLFRRDLVPGRSDHSVGAGTLTGAARVVAPKLRLDEEAYDHDLGHSDDKKIVPVGLPHRGAVSQVLVRLEGGPA